MSLYVDGYPLVTVLPTDPGNQTILHSTSDLVLGAGFVGNLDELEILNPAASFLTIAGGNTAVIGPAGWTEFTVSSTGMLANDPNPLGRVLTLQVTNPTSGQAVNCLQVATMAALKVESSMFSGLGRFVHGFVAGWDADFTNIAGLTGDLASGFLIWGDLRDGTLFLFKFAITGEDLGIIDTVCGILAVAGIVATVNPALDLVVGVGKLLAKMARAGWKFAKHLMTFIRDAVEEFLLRRVTTKLAEGEFLFSQIADVVSRGDQAAMNALEDVGSSANAVADLPKAAAALKTPGRTLPDVLVSLKNLGLSADHLAGVVHLAAHHPGYFAKFSDDALEAVGEVLKRMNPKPGGQEILGNLFSHLRNLGVGDDAANLIMEKVNLLAKAETPFHIPGKDTFERWMLGLAATRRAGGMLADQSKTFDGALWELKCLTEGVEPGQLKGVQHISPDGRLGPDGLGPNNQSLEAKFRVDEPSLRLGIESIKAQVASVKRRFGELPTGRIFINLLPSQQTIDDLTKAVREALDESGQGLREVVVEFYDMPAISAIDDFITRPLSDVSSRKITVLATSP